MNDDDEKTERVIRRYRKFLQMQPGPVGGKIRSFFNTYSLNDALLDRLRVFEGARKVEFTLVEGDNARGYRLLKLTYLGAHTREGSTGHISRILYRRNAVVRYDEFDRSRTSKTNVPVKFFHRFLFWPRALGSFAIAFENFMVSEMTIDTRRYDTYGKPYEVIPD